MIERKTNKTIAKHFNNMLLISIIVDILMVIIGIILLLLPDASSKVIGIIVGLLFIVNGVSVGYKYFKREGAKLYSLNLMFGILSALLGLILIFYPYTVMDFVTICLGVYLIINGALSINYGIWLKVGKENSWLITVVTGILLLLFGILVIFNPFASLTVTQLIGAFLIILAILQATNTILFKKRADEIMKIFW